MEEDSVDTGELFDESRSNSASPTPEPLPPLTPSLATPAAPSAAASPDSPTSSRFTDQSAVLAGAVDERASTLAPCAASSTADTAAAGSGGEAPNKRSRGASGAAASGGDDRTTRGGGIIAPSSTACATAPARAPEPLRPVSPHGLGFEAEHLGAAGARGSAPVQPKPAASGAQPRAQSFRPASPHSEGSDHAAIQVDISRVDKARSLVIADDITLQLARLREDILDFVGGGRSKDATVAAAPRSSKHARTAERPRTASAPARRAPARPLAADGILDRLGRLQSLLAARDADNARLYAELTRLRAAELARIKLLRLGLSPQSIESAVYATGSLAPAALAERESVLAALVDEWQARASASSRREASVAREAARAAGARATELARALALEREASAAARAHAAGLQARADEASALRQELRDSHVLVAQLKARLDAGRSQYVEMASQLEAATRAASESARARATEGSRARRALGRLQARTQALTAERDAALAAAAEANVRLAAVSTARFAPTTAQPLARSSAVPPSSYLAYNSEGGKVPELAPTPLVPSVAEQPHLASAPAAGRFSVSPSPAPGMPAPLDSSPGEQPRLASAPAAGRFSVSPSPAVGVPAPLDSAAEQPHVELSAPSNDRSADAARFAMSPSPTPASASEPEPKPVASSHAFVFSDDESDPPSAPAPPPQGRAFVTSDDDV